jgi:hypothetical protein
MAMVLGLFGISLVLTVVTAILLSQISRAAETSPPVRENPHTGTTPRFFQSDMPLSVPGLPASPVPVEALILEIEQHVRMERAIAESFHLSPTPQSLHVHTSPTVMH